MIVAFPFAFAGKEETKHIALAELFVKQMRKYQPHAKIIQMSDRPTAAIKGTDGCVRTDSWPLGLWSFTSAMTFPEPQFLKLDYDTIVQGDVSDVFEQDFDIAIAKERSHEVMNNGVVFVQNREFFADALKRYETETQMDNWRNVQDAMQLTINSGRFNVLKLEPDVYNYFTSKEEGLTKAARYPTSAKILHFKGSRKMFMSADFQ